MKNVKYYGAYDHMEVFKMQRTKWLSVLLGLLLVLALSLVVSAQDGESTEEPPMSTEEAVVTEAVADEDENGDDGSMIPEGGTGLLTTAQGTRFVTGFQGAIPLNASVLGVAYLTGFDTYTFNLGAVAGLSMNTTAGQAVAAEATADPSLSALAACGLVRVYKVSSEGSQDLWTQVSCDGDTLSVVAGGTGHYILYTFNNQTAVNGAPQTLSTCIGTFEATQEAGSSLGQSVQLDGNQVCWNFSAIDDIMTPATVSATAAPPSADASDDNGDDEAAVEPTVEVTEGV